MKNEEEILCLSWCDADDVMNYGQILQGCAMMYILRQLTDGVIRYVSFFPRGLKRKVKYLLKHYNPFSGHLFAYLRSKRIIDSFIHHYNIQFYQISKERKLEAISRNAHYILCGSDQIWHPQNYDKIYFLNFGSKNAKRISFAASLPKTKVEKQYVNEYQKMKLDLAKFNLISVREAQSCEFITELSGLSVSSVLDPTYLVDEMIWEEYIENIDVPDQYIFVYIPNGMDENMLILVNKIKEEMGISNVFVMITRGKSYFNDFKELNFVSVGQFLYLIKQAACVVTSSFHAVVFSTIFHREFWCYDVPNKIRGEDVRLIDLLKKLKLEDRRIDMKKFIDISEMIDYKSVYNIISEEKCKSIEFLKEALEYDI